MFTQSKPVLNRILLDAAGPLSPKFQDPIFIICAPRSGSTFFYHSIRRMTGIFSFGRENTPMWIRIFPYSRVSPPSDYIASEECSLKAINTIKTFILTKGIVHGFSFENPNSRSFDMNVAFKYALMRQPIVYMEKTIANCFHLDAISKIFPDARFIHLVRDGRANVSSMIEGWNTFVKVGIDFPFPENSTVPYWSYALPPGWHKTLHRPIEQICAWSWVEHNRYILDKLGTDEQFKSRYLKVFYEDFVENPLMVIKQIAESFNLEVSKNCVDYLNSKPLSRTTISKPKTDKWKLKNGEKIKNILDEILPMMEQLGYSSVT